MAACLVLTAEIGARLLLAPIESDAWAYWDEDAATKFEWFRHQVLSGAVPDVLVIGDSIAARNFDPAAFMAEAPGLEAYNLGWPGMFPMALGAVVLPILRSGPLPEVVVLIQSPMSYVENERVRRNEAPIVGSIQARRLQGESLPSDTFALTRIYASRQDAVAYWIGGKSLEIRPPPARGFMPHKRPKGQETEPPSAIGPRAEPLDQERRDVFIQLVELIAERNGSLIVVRSPTLSHGSSPIERSFEDWLVATQQSGKGFFEICDLSTYKEIDRRYFRDWLHLWDDGAAKFSRLVFKVCFANKAEKN